MRISVRRTLAGGLAVGALLSPLAVGTAATAAPAAPAPAPAARAALGDVTSALEAARVDRVPTPRLGWYRCYETAQCATVDLPLDYDEPNGPTTEVAVLRVKARDPEKRIGSLFVNPGGPGGSATELAGAAPWFLRPALLDRFDIVGVDPRGVGSSDQLRCFGSTREQTRTLRPLLARPFPLGDRQEAAFVDASRATGAACSTTGRPLSAAMSTAQTARDMEVVRRAVGDAKLSFLGFSYGSYLGQVYANMFPDRVRAVAIDGVLDPLAWAGTPATRDVPSTERLRSAQGAYKALRETLERCDEAGRRACAFAAGNPVKRYDRLAEQLKADPLVVRTPEGTFRFTYADLVSLTLSALYDSQGPDALGDLLPLIAELASDPAAGRAAELERRLSRPGFDFPYENSLEAFAGVLCTDGLNPRDAAAWPDAADRADRDAPYFGRLWTWASSPCASGTWTAQDEDAYRGPFTRTTSAPVLVVGNRWDPATSYRGAKRAAALLPNSRLLTSDSWGHTAYGSSACVDKAMVRYLVQQAVPAEGTRCTGDVQPFQDPRTQQAQARTADSGVRAPIVPFVPVGGLGR